MPQRKSTIADNPILIGCWDYEANNRLDPHNIGGSYGRSLQWRCAKCNTPFIAKGKTVISRNGMCRSCYLEEKNKLGQNKESFIRYGSLADVPEIMALWCDDNPDPRTLHKTDKVKVNIRCADCGKITSHPVIDIYREHAFYCKECTSKRRAEKYQAAMIEKTGSCKDYPEIMEVWDFSKNDLDPSKVPSGSRYVINCKCPICGSKWKTKVFQRKGKKPMCRLCAIRSMVHKRDEQRNQDFLVDQHKSFGDTVYRFVDWWHPTLNGSLTPYDIAPSSSKTYYWRCPNNHVFSATASSMKSRRFCPICRPTIHSSFIEMAIAFYLRKIIDIDQWKQIKGTRQSIDIYIPRLKVGIEYDGVRYHNNRKQIKRDSRKSEILKRQGIRLIRIQEWQNDSHNDSSIFYDYNKADLQGLMNILCDMLSIEKVSVDLSKDTADIYKLLYPEAVRNSISEISPQLVPYWDEEANGGVTPEKVNAYSALFFYWRCPDCGATWTQSPIGMKRRKSLCQVCHPYNHHKGGRRDGETE
mgnify:FL=1